MIGNTKADTDEDIENALIALRRAAKKVHEKARRNGDSVIIYKDGQVVEWFPDTDTCKAVKPEVSDFQ
jgi:hypothetical protein